MTRELLTTNSLSCLIPQDFNSCLYLIQSQILQSLKDVHMLSDQLMRSLLRDLATKLVLTTFTVLIHILLCSRCPLRELCIYVPVCPHVIL